VNRRAGRVAAALAVVLMLWPAGARGQRQAQPEVRLDVATPARVEVGGGIAVPAGLYARIGGAVAAGWRDGPGGGGASARVEVTARFHLDPFGASRWGPYGVGGVQVGCAVRTTCRPALMARIGFEGPVERRGGWRPVIEAGLGDGAHLAVALRRAMPRRR
jgi:hypothetical protein